MNDRIDLILTVVILILFSISINKEMELNKKIKSKQIITLSNSNYVCKKISEAREKR